MDSLQHDKGELWQWSAAMEHPTKLAEHLRQVMHDRDRFQRERDYWHEECIALAGEALA